MKNVLTNIIIILAISAIYVLVATLDERALTSQTPTNSEGDSK